MNGMTYGLTGTELAEYYAEMAETYRQLLSAVALVERRHSFRRSMIAYQNLCAEIMVQVQAVQP